MKTFLKWTKGLRAKLMILGITPLLALLLVVFFAHVTVNHLEERLKFAYQVRIKLTEQTGDMASAIHAMGRWMWIANGFSGNPEKQNVFLNKAKAEVEFFEKTKQEFLGMPGTEKVTGALSQIEEHWPKAKTALHRASVAYSKNTAADSAVGKEILSTDFVKNLVPITDTFNEINKSMDDILAAEISTTETEVAYSRKILWIVGLISTTLTLLLAVLLGSHLAKVFSEVCDQIDVAAKDTASASVQLSQASQILSTGASTVAVSLEKTISSVDEINGMIKKNASNALQAGVLSIKSQQSAVTGQKEVTEMLKAIGDLAVTSKRNEQIIHVVNDITSQSNLLAKTASAEAARAGQDGEGITVVAEAARSLAQRSAEAAKDISRMIQESVSKTDQGVTLAQRSGDILKEIVDSIKTVTALNHDIAHASRDQAFGLSRISVTMEQMDHTTDKNAASSEEVGASSEKMSAQARQLSELVKTLNHLINGPVYSK
jgi:methyl-accepting chemotaxis protein